MKLSTDFNAIKRFFDEVWQDPGSLPKNSLVLSLDEKDISTLFTKKRIQLIKLIKRLKACSISKLAKASERELSAVMRDLKILEEFGIVDLEKKGRVMTVSTSKELIVVPIVKPAYKKLDQIEKKEILA